MDLERNQTSTSPLSRYSLNDLIQERDITVRDLRDIEAEIYRRAGSVPRNLPQRILAWLAIHGEGTPAQIAREVAADARYVGTALKRLKSSHLVSRVRHGVYSIRIKFVSSACVNE